MNKNTPGDFAQFHDRDARIPEGSVCTECDRVMRSNAELMLVLAMRKDYYVDPDTGKTVNRTGVSFCECYTAPEARPRYAE